MVRQDHGADERRDPHRLNDNRRTRLPFPGITFSPRTGVITMDAFGGRTLTIVVSGRVGSALPTALRASSAEINGPVRRGQRVGGDIVLLAVPDREIEAAMPGARGT